MYISNTWRKSHSNSTFHRSTVTQFTSTQENLNSLSLLINYFLAYVQAANFFVLQ